MTDPTAPNTRILIGAGSFADASAALRIASHLLQGLTGSLGGLLVEQEEVLAHCRLPNRNVVSASGTVAMAPSLAEMRRLMAADAWAFRQRLSELAGAPAASFSFSQRTGDLVDASVHEGRAWDVLIFGYRRVHSVPGQVVWLHPLPPRGTQAARLARRLAHRLNTELVGFGVGPPRAGPGDVEAPPRGLRLDTLDAALSRLTRLNAQAVVVDLSQGPVRTHDDLRRLIEGARCPVVVLGAASDMPMLEHNAHFPSPPPHAAPRS